MISEADRKWLDEAQKRSKSFVEEKYPGGIPMEPASLKRTDGLFQYQLVEVTEHDLTDQILHVTSEEDKAKNAMEVMLLNRALEELKVDRVKLNEFILKERSKLKVRKIRYEIV